MRHLLILNERDIHHPSAGGAEVNLFEVARRLVDRGYAITLLCSAFPGARREEMIDGVKVHRLGTLSTYYLRVPGAVRRNLRADSVVIEHLCKLPFCTPLYVRRPVIAVTHHLFGRTTFWQAAPPIAAAVLAAERLIPPVYRRCRFIAVSPSTKADLIRRGIDAERIRIIPNGVDSGHYRVEPEPSGSPTLLAFGRIEPYKRFDLILDVFERVRAAIPEARLSIVGGGSGLDVLRQGIRRRGLTQSVSSTGPVDEQEKLRQIHACHLVLAASEKEGWGLTVLEAAACGRATVASDVPGLRDAVLHERTGVLVPHGEVGAYAAACVDLLLRPEHRRQLGAGARAWAERFSWDGVAEATAQCIEENCGAAPAPIRNWFVDPVEIEGGTVSVPQSGWTR